MRIPRRPVPVVCSLTLGCLLLAAGEVEAQTPVPICSTRNGCATVGRALQIFRLGTTLVMRPSQCCATPGSYTLFVIGTAALANPILIPPPAVCCGVPANLWITPLVVLPSNFNAGTVCSAFDEFRAVLPPIPGPIWVQAAQVCGGFPCFYMTQAYDLCMGL
jgi:hypothetical protein